MIAPYTILMHTISGALSLFVFLWIEVVFKKRSHKVEVAHNFAAFFFFYFLYNLSFALLNIISPGKPFADNSGNFIFWNPDRLNLNLTLWGLTGVAFIFAAIFFFGAFKMESAPLKIRSLIFATGAASFANAALYYFRAQTITDLILGLAFGVAGVFIIALGLVIPNIIQYSRFYNPRLSDMIKK